MDLDKIIQKIVGDIEESKQAKDNKYFTVDDILTVLLEFDKIKCFYHSSEKNKNKIINCICIGD